MLKDISTMVAARIRIHILTTQPSEHKTSLMHWTARPWYLSFHFCIFFRHVFITSSYRKCTDPHHRDGTQLNGSVKYIGIIAGTIGVIIGIVVAICKWTYIQLISIIYKAVSFFLDCWFQLTFNNQHESFSVLHIYGKLFY